MVNLTISTLIQLLAMLTIPTIVGVIALTQMNAKAKFQWKQGRIALLLSTIPVLVIFALQGLFTPWMALLTFGGLFLTILLVRPDQN